MYCHSPAIINMSIFDLVWYIIDIEGYRNDGDYPDQETVDQLLPERFENKEANRKVLLQWLAEFKTLQDTPNPPSIDNYKKSMPVLPIPCEEEQKLIIIDGHFHLVPVKGH